MTGCHAIARQGSPQCPRCENPDNTFLSHGLQMTEEWCRSVKEHNGRVAVYIEGLPEQGDKQKQLLQTLNTLKTQEVAFSLRVMIDRQNSQHPESFYRYLRELGTPFMQFIPRLEMNDHQPDEHSVEAKAWGAFLCSVFDVWVREDVGSVYVQLFDSTLDIWASQKGVKKATLTSECLQCEVVRLCQGDCPRNRDEQGKSVLCEGYNRFFQYTAPYMKVMRDLIRQRRSPMELMVMLRQQNQDSQTGC